MKTFPLLLFASFSFSASLSEEKTPALLLLYLCALKCVRGCILYIQFYSYPVLQKESACAW